MDYSKVKMLSIEDAQTIADRMKAVRYRMYDIDLDKVMPSMPAIYTSASAELRKAIVTDFIDNNVYEIANEFSGLFEIATAGETWSNPVFNEKIARDLTAKFYEIYDSAKIINIHDMSENNIKSVTIAMYVFIEAYIAVTGVTKIAQDQG